MKGLPAALYIIDPTGDGESGRRRREGSEVEFWYLVRYYFTRKGVWILVMFGSFKRARATPPGDLWEVVLDFVHDLASASTIWPENIEITF